MSRSHGGIASVAPASTYLRLRKVLAHPRRRSASTARAITPKTTTKTRLRANAPGVTADGEPADATGATRAARTSLRLPGPLCRRVCSSVRPPDPDPPGLSGPRPPGASFVTRNAATHPSPTVEVPDAPPGAIGPCPVGSGPVVESGPVFPKMSGVVVAVGGGRSGGPVVSGGGVAVGPVGPVGPVGGGGPVGPVGGGGPVGPVGGGGPVGPVGPVCARAAAEDTTRETARMMTTAPRRRLPDDHRSPVTPRGDCCFARTRTRYTPVSNVQVEWFAGSESRSRGCGSQPWIGSPPGETTYQTSPMP
jgi:hypothetical protein